MEISVNGYSIHTSKLRDISEETERSEGIQKKQRHSKEVKTFKPFNDITSSCFGEELTPNFVELIESCHPNLLVYI